MAAKNNLARKLNKVPAFRTYAISLSPDVALEYELQAGDRDTGAILSTRLEDPLVVNHTSQKPLYWTDEQRKELDALLEYNFSSADQVLQRLRSLMTTVRIADADGTAELVLSPSQLYRLDERAKIMGVSIPEYCRRLANSAINFEIGLF